MSCEINGKLLVDRTKVKPRNYTEQITSSRELKSEVLYWLYFYQRHKEVKKADEEAYKNRRREWFCPDHRHSMTGGWNDFGGTSTLDGERLDNKYSWG